MTPMPDNDFQDGLQRLEGLLQEAEQGADRKQQARLRAIVQSLLDLHAAGLRRMLDRLAESGGDAAREACADDSVIGGLLLLHGLHPLGVEERVQKALERVTPYLRSNGGEVELLEIEEGVARLRLEVRGCASTAEAVRRVIEEAILAKAPDVAVAFDAGDDAPDVNGAHRVALTVL